MKMTVFLAAAALVCGSAMAADSQGEHGQRVSREHAAQASGEHANGGLMDKTRRAFSRMGDKIRHTGQRLGHALGTDKDAPRHDTRAMGAAGARPAQDQREDQREDRRERMDDAYANWRSQHQKESR